MGAAAAAAAVAAAAAPGAATAAAAVRPRHLLVNTEVRRHRTLGVTSVGMDETFLI